jgi:serine/threonine-protein kinase
VAGAPDDQGGVIVGATGEPPARVRAESDELLADTRDVVPPGAPVEDDDAEGDDTDVRDPDERTPPAHPAARRRTTSMVPIVVDALLAITPAPPTRGAATPMTEDARGTTATTPLEALRAEEIARTRVFLKVCFAIALAALAVIQFGGGHHGAKLAVDAGASLVMVVVGWLLWVTRDPAGYTTRRVIIGAVALVIGAFGGVYYWGVASPACAMILYGIYFFGFGGHRAATRLIYVLCAGMHLALGVAICTGLIADRGIVRITNLAPIDQVMTQAVVQFLYLCAFFTARMSRRTTIDAVSRLERAVRGVAQREALLAEARAELDRALKIGGPGRYTDQIVGRYRLGPLIGRGGMGEVYEAAAVEGGGAAAVKLLHPSALSDPQHVRRFLREADAASRLDCPNVVRVLQVGTTAGETPFLAMERLRGVDLAHHLRRHRRLGAHHVATLIRQIGNGLTAARSAGIVHRDIKPHNLFLAEEPGGPTWKILDFGISKVASSAGTLTRGHVVGTPGYMAPEQARGDDVDWRADLYSLAAIAYRALTGHPPFTGKDVPATLYDVVYKMPTRPSLLAELPEDLDRVLAIGMAKDPARRWISGDELADALTAAASSSLSDELRRRADDLVMRHPWGQPATTLSR